MTYLVFPAVAFLFYVGATTMESSFIMNLEAKQPKMR